MYTSTAATTKLDASALPIMLNTEQVSQILNVSSKHVRDMCREQTIRAVRVGGTWRVPRDPLLEMFGLAQGAR